MGADGTLNYGVETDRIGAAPRYWVGGEPATFGEVEEAFGAKWQLADDSAKWHLTVVGDASLFARVKADTPAECRGKLHLQCYGPTAWQVARFKLDAGVTLRRGGPGRVVDLGVSLSAAAYTPADLADLLREMDGPRPKPPEPKPPAPKPEPVKPDPRPTPAPEPKPEPVAPVVVTVIVPVVIPGPATPGPEPRPAPSGPADPRPEVKPTAPLVVPDWLLAAAALFVALRLGSPRPQPTTPSGGAP